MGLGLEVRNLTVRKSGYTLLHNISLSVSPGEFVAILGPNGAGKTTLLKAIAGERPYSGSVCIDGENLYDDPERWFKQIGQVPVDNILHDRLPVRKALRYIGVLRNVPPKELEQRISGLLREFGIEYATHSLIYKLSSGERKKVNICAELLTKPGLLLLDEPTTNLDPDAEKELMAQLEKRARQGTTIIIVSHTINSLEHCDRVIFMGNSVIQECLERWQVRSMDPRAWSAKFAAQKTQKRELTSNPKKESVLCQGIGTTKSESSSRLSLHSSAALDRVTGQHYGVVLSRHLELLYYEGLHLPVRETWERVKALLFGNSSSTQKRVGRRSLLDWNWMIPLPLILALAFGPLTGVLLTWVLPDEALVHSEKLISVDAADASQAAFLIGFVALLIGLVGSFREVAREINIYQHERLKGLQVRAYLLAKFSLYGVLYGIISPFLMLLVLAVYQKFPQESLLLGGTGNALLTLVLTSLAGVALGLAVSCLGSRGELATVLMGVAVIANALLSGLVINEGRKKLIDTLSIFVPSRWAMESLKTNTQVFCWAVNRLLRDHYSLTHLLAIWTALLAYMLVALMLAYLALHHKDTWFKPLRRFKPLMSQRTYAYTVATVILVIIGFGLYKLSSQAYEAELFTADVDSLQGLQRAIGKVAAADCVIEEPPSAIDEETFVPEVFVPTLTPVLQLTPTATLVSSMPTDQAPEPSPVEQQTEPTELASTPTVPNLPENTPASSPEPTVEPTSISTPSPTAPVVDDLAIEIQTSVEVYYAPATQAKKMSSAPPNSTLRLLSQTTYNGHSWLRVQALDELGRSHVGWVDASDSQLSPHVWKVSVERKVPPDCTTPLASTYRKMEDFDLAAGKLGSWVSDGAGEVAVVVDLFRENVGTPSDNLTLVLKLNGEEQRLSPIEPQRKRFLLQNGVYNLQVTDGSRLDLVLRSASSETLDVLQAHVSIFFVPQNCEFGEE